jgi:hypothetical protein
MMHNYKDLRQPVPGKIHRKGKPSETGKKVKLVEGIAYRWDFILSQNKRYLSKKEHFSSLVIF